MSSSFFAGPIRLATLAPFQKPRFYWVEVVDGLLILLGGIGINGVCLENRDTDSLWFWFTLGACGQIGCPTRSVSAGYALCFPSLLASVEH